MVAKKTVAREIAYHHREDADWLTMDICNEYRKKW